MKKLSLSKAGSLAQAARAKSVRLLLAPIGLKQSVNEMTAHPRPASTESTTVVETDHPLCSYLPTAGIAF